MITLTPEQRGMTEAEQMAIKLKKFEDHRRKERGRKWMTRAFIAILLPLFLLFTAWAFVAGPFAVIAWALSIFWTVLIVGAVAYVLGSLLRGRWT